MKWESKCIILELMSRHGVSSEEQAATDSTATVKTLHYLYKLSASFNKPSASVNRGTALYSKGTGRLCCPIRTELKIKQAKTRTPGGRIGQEYARPIYPWNRLGARIASPKAGSPSRSYSESFFSDISPRTHTPTKPK